MAENSQQKAPIKAKVRATNDIYTALLGLAVLTLLATIAFVCVYSYQRYDAIFTVG